MKKILASIKRNLIDGPLAVIGYIKARLLEASTWTAIGLGVPIAAALSAPWSYVSIAIAVVVAILPTTPKNPPSN